jgi:hypothetical protein
MAVRREFVSLRVKLGDDGLLDLHEMVEANQRRWKDDVMNTASDRFERRLNEELSGLKVEMAKEFATTRVSLLRWMFALWTSAILAFLVK